MYNIIRISIVMPILDQVGLAVDDIKGILKAAVLKRLALQVGSIYYYCTVYCIIKLMNNHVAKELF